MKVGKLVPEKLKVNVIALIVLYDEILPCNGPLKVC